jgi:hypothetical protein
VSFALMGDPFLDNNLIEKLKYVKDKYNGIEVRAANTMQMYNE